MKTAARPNRKWPHLPQAVCPVVLVCGEDEFAVKQRAKEIIPQWTRGTGRHGPRNHRCRRLQQRRSPQDLRRLREALQTLPFFGTAKAIWLQNCNFLGDERVALAPGCHRIPRLPGAGTQGVLLAKRPPAHQRRKVDKRKVFYKTLDKLGTVENLRRDGPWMTGIGRTRRKPGRARRCAPAKRRFPTRPWPNWSTGSARTPANWTTKSRSSRLYVGDRPGNRNGGRGGRLHPEQDGAGLCPGRCPGRPGPAASAAVPGRGVVGGKARSAEIGNRPALRPDCQSARDDPAEGDAARRLDQAERRITTVSRPNWSASRRSSCPQDRRFNPLALNPYVLFKALPQVKRYSAGRIDSARWNSCCSATSAWCPAAWTNRWCCSKHWCRLWRRGGRRVS